MTFKYLTLGHLTLGHLTSEISLTLTFDIETFNIWHFENLDICHVKIFDIWHLTFQSIYAEKMANFDSWCFWRVPIQSIIYSQFWRARVNWMFDFIKNSKSHHRRGFCSENSPSCLHSSCLFSSGVNILCLKIKQLLYIRRGDDPTLWKRIF